MGTKISWTDETWNPSTGCSRVSDGCRFCYAEALSLRYGYTKKPWTAGNAPDNVALHTTRLLKPHTWKTPKRVFVNSMSDLFHELIPFDFLDAVFAVMRATPQHTYQVLTKRPERAAEYSALLEERVCRWIQSPEGRLYTARVGSDLAVSRVGWPDNVWMGTSIESNRHVDRADDLRRVLCKVRFLSCEPLLGPLPDLDLWGIHWVIVGGESGNHMGRHPERQMDHAWARQIRALCCPDSVAFFFKQSSGARTEMGTALIEEDGSAWEWHQFPGHMDPPRLVTPAREAV